LRFAKPLDEKLLHTIFQKFDKIITIEDGCLQGGFGSSILEFMANNDYQAKVKMLGIPDIFIHHGTQEELYNDCHYDTKAIVSSVQKILEKSLITQAG
jgi:1-deoxy-D-xylulose-5-phosphate synthase